MIQDGLVIQYASDRLQADHQISLIAVAQNQAAFYHIQHKFRSDWVGSIVSQLPVGMSLVTKLAAIRAVDTLKLALRCGAASDCSAAWAEELFSHRSKTGVVTQFERCEQTVGVLCQTLTPRSFPYFPPRYRAGIQSLMLDELILHRMFASKGGSGLFNTILPMVLAYLPRDWSFDVSSGVDVYWTQRQAELEEGRREVARLMEQQQNEIMNNTSSGTKTIIPADGNKACCATLPSVTRNTPCRHLPSRSKT